MRFMFICSFNLWHTLQCLQPRINCYALRNVMYIFLHMPPWMENKAAMYDKALNYYYIHTYIRSPCFISIDNYMCATYPKINLRTQPYISVWAGYTCLIWILNRYWYVYLNIHQPLVFIISCIYSFRSIITFSTWRHLEGNTLVWTDLESFLRGV